MSGGAVVLMVALVVGAVLAPTLVVGFARRRTRAGGRIVEDLLGDDVVLLDERARCYGLASLPSPQISGPGALALGAEVLLFVQPAPRCEVWVGRERIVEVDARRAHLGAAAVDAMLWVRWRSDDGGSDAAAFAVDDLPRWLDALT